MPSKITRPHFVLCIDDRDSGESLERCKVYRVLADARAEKRGLLRVVDDTGEDYLYPREMFVTVALPISTSRLLAKLMR